jgi:hypothetical protein
MKPLQKMLLMITTLLLGMVWLLPVNAVPAFATQTDKKCSYCHNAWPQLNHKGRQFKQRGYQLPDSDPVQLGDYLQDLDSFPISGVVVSRPYDKKEHGNTNNRGFHEAEVMFAGAFNKFSAFFELEAEDEATNDFGLEIGIPLAAMSYHHNPAVNLTATWGEQFYSDPYGGLLSHHNRLTRDSVGVIDTAFGGADNGGKIKSARQSVGLWGRVINDRVFYNVAWQGEADDGTTKSSEGKDASNILTRVAFDITDDIMIGGFYIDGKMNGSGAPDRDFSRWGVDAQMDYNNLRLQGAYVSAQGDNVVLGGVEQNNDAFSVQAYYTFKKKSGRPTFVPLVRYDWSERRDGSQQDESIVFNLGYYVTQNVRVYAEYFHEIDDFGTKKEEDRFTLQAFITF